MRIDFLGKINGYLSIILRVYKKLSCRLSTIIFNAENDNFNSVTVPLKEAQAAWNFALLREDRSKGIHNPNYAKALIANSIEALQS